MSLCSYLSESWLRGSFSIIGNYLCVEKGFIHLAETQKGSVLILKKTLLVYCWKSFVRNRAIFLHYFELESGISL